MLMLEGFVYVYYATNDQKYTNGLALAVFFAKKVFLLLFFNVSFFFI